MGDTATDMRDPMFYRWHAFIDDIFQEYKNTLPQYNIQQVSMYILIHINIGVRESEYDGSG